MSRKMKTFVAKSDHSMRGGIRKKTRKQNNINKKKAGNRVM